MIQIRNEHLRYWRVEKEEIRRLAEKNTPRIYPVQIRQIVRFMYVATNEQCSLGQRGCGIRISGKRSGG